MPANKKGNGNRIRPEKADIVAYYRARVIAEGWHGKEPTEPSELATEMMEWWKEPMPVDGLGKLERDIDAGNREDLRRSG